MADEIRVALREKPALINFKRKKSKGKRLPPVGGASPKAGAKLGSRGGFFCGKNKTSVPHQEDTGGGRLRGRARLAKSLDCYLMRLEGERPTQEVSADDSGDPVIKNETEE